MMRKVNLTVLAVYALLLNDCSAALLNKTDANGKKKKDEPKCKESLEANHADQGSGFVRELTLDTPDLAAGKSPQFGDFQFTEAKNLEQNKGPCPNCGQPVQGAMQRFGQFGPPTATSMPPFHGMGQFDTSAMINRFQKSIVEPMQLNIQKQIEQHKKQQEEQERERKRQEQLEQEKKAKEAEETAEQEKQQRAQQTLQQKQMHRQHRQQTQPQLQQPQMQQAWQEQPRQQCHQEPVQQQWPQQMHEPQQQQQWGPPRPFGHMQMGMPMQGHPQCLGGMDCGSFSQKQQPPQWQSSSPQQQQHLGMGGQGQWQQPQPDCGCQQQDNDQSQTFQKQQQPSPFMFGMQGPQQNMADWGAPPHQQIPWQQPFQGQQQALTVDQPQSAPPQFDMTMHQQGGDDATGPTITDCQTCPQQQQTGGGFGWSMPQQQPQMQAPGWGPMQAGGMMQPNPYQMMMMQRMMAARQQQGMPNMYAGYGGGGNQMSRMSPPWMQQQSMQPQQQQQQSGCPSWFGGAPQSQQALNMMPLQAQQQQQPSGQQSIAGPMHGYGMGMMGAQGGAAHSGWCPSRMNGGYMTPSYGGSFP